MPRSTRFTFLEYLVVTVFFWILCGLLFLVTWLVTGETEGMTYFFLSLAIGFTVVALLSWLHDLFYKEEEGSRESQPASSP